jgi:hypothetical protein
MTRAEHLQWCKDRALEYVNEGKLTLAFSSMVSDLGKHDELANHAGIRFGTELLLSGHLETEPKMREFITGFN